MWKSSTSSNILKHRANCRGSTILASCIDLIGPGDYVNYEDEDMLTYSATVPAGTVGILTQAAADSIAAGMACANARQGALLYGPRSNCETTDHPHGGPTGAVDFTTPICY